MSKQNQAMQSATATKTQQKPAPTPMQELATAPEIAGVLDFAGTTSFANNAQRLGNPNLPRIQRQMMAGRIGQMQGNGHLGQVMAFVQHRHRTPHLSSVQQRQAIQNHGLSAPRPRIVQTKANESGRSEGICPTCGKRGIGTCSCGHSFMPIQRQVASGVSDDLIQRFRDMPEDKVERADDTVESEENVERQVEPDQNESSPVDEQVTDEQDATNIVEAPADPTTAVRNKTGRDDTQSSASLTGDREISAGNFVDQAEPLAEGAQALSTQSDEESVDSATSTKTPDSNDELKTDKVKAASDETLLETGAETEISSANEAVAEVEPLPGIEEGSLVQAPPNAPDASSTGVVADGQAQNAIIESSDNPKLKQPESDTSGGAGGDKMASSGGGGGAIEELPAPPPVPDVSKANPSDAMAMVGNLPLVELHKSLGGVAASVDNLVGQKQEELASNPPELQRPSGAPVRIESEASLPELKVGNGPEQVARKPEGQNIPVQEPSPVPMGPPPPVTKTSAPQSAAELTTAVAGIPSYVPQGSLNIGPSPQLKLVGNADPTQIQSQDAELTRGLQEAHTEGQKEVAAPMGEDEVYPVVPPEVLRANIPSRSNRSATANISGGDIPVGNQEGSAEALSIIAQEEQGVQIRSAVGEAQGQVAAQQQDHQAKVAQEEAKSRQEIAQLTADNAAQQAQQRAAVKTEVTQMRGQWSGEQQQLVQGAQQETAVARQEGMEQVAQEQSRASAAAATHIAQGQQEAQRAKIEGEQRSQTAKEKGQNESGSVLGNLISGAKQLFDKVKSAVQSAIQWAQKRIKEAIDAAKKLAAAAIEVARQQVISIIKKVGSTLIAIGDRVLSAFPKLRDRFRTMITQRIKQATAAVKQLAGLLKQGVQKALDLLGTAYHQLLGFLQTGLNIIVEKVQAVVKGALDLAQKAVAMAGTLVVLIKDIAADPLGWLSNLGNGAEEGIMNHLWTAFQSQVKEWFSKKLEQVLGLGLQVWEVLKKGGIDIAKIGQMAWDALVNAIPTALITILVEKLVSLIVPAAGAIMTIIEGLKAAWGTVGTIIGAIEHFMPFLQAVRPGKAGPPFASLIAAAAVSVIDFVSNWLLGKLKLAGKMVANRLKGIAKGFMSKLKRKAKGALAKLTGRFGKKKLADREKSQDLSEQPGVNAEGTHVDQSVAKRRAIEETTTADGRNIRTLENGMVVQCEGGCVIVKYPTKKSKGAILAEEQNLGDPGEGYHWAAVNGKPARRRNPQLGESSEDKPRKSDAAYGDIKPYSQQGKALWDDDKKRLSEHEHIRARKNLELQTTNPATGDIVFGDKEYRESHTLTIPRDMAVIKTRGDRDVIRDQKEAIRTREITPELRDQMRVHTDIERTIAAREQAIADRIAAGNNNIEDLQAITDEKIITAAHLQQQQLFVIGERQESPINQATDDEIEAAFATWNSF